jgi:uncharacterized protein YbjT (DUF2867 family)
MGVITVTGGTGTLGRHVVAGLVERGHDVLVLSRHAPTTSEVLHRSVDLRTGVGLDEAVHGSDTIVHCATSPRGDARAAGRLVSAAARAGVRHIVFISIVGIDRVPFAYYRAKLAAEHVIRASGVPWTILRATQFHDLLIRLWAAQRRSPAVLAPDLPFQPIDAREVAARLVFLAENEPAGRVDDMGGPEVRPALDLARTYLRAVGVGRPVVPVRLPGNVFRQFRAGGHLTPEHATGIVTYDEYLAAHLAP